MTKCSIAHGKSALVIEPFVVTSTSMPVSLTYSPSSSRWKIPSRCSRVSFGASVLPPALWMRIGGMTSLPSAREKKPSVT